MILRHGKVLGNGEGNMESVSIPTDMLMNMLGLTMEEVQDSTRVQEALALKLAATVQVEIPPQAAAVPIVENGIENANAIQKDPIKLKLPLPTFSGRGDPKSPSDFIMELERFAASKGVEPQQLLARAIPVSMTGPARRWWEFKKGFTKWSDFTDALSREYGATNYKRVLKRELEARTQHPDEALTSFIQAIDGYYVNIGEPVNETERVQRVLNQMHPEFRRLVGGRTFASLQELADSAPDFQEMLLNDRLYKPPPPSAWSVEPSLAWNGPARRDMSAAFAAALPAAAVPELAASEAASAAVSATAATATAAGTSIWLQGAGGSAAADYRYVGLNAIDPYMTRYLPSWGFPVQGLTSAAVEQAKKPFKPNKGKKEYKAANGQSSGGTAQQGSAQTPGQNGCWRCGDISHYRRDCPLVPKNGGK